MTPKTIARIIRRNGGPDDGLLLGVVFKSSGTAVFKPGRVYEIVQDPLDEIRIVDVGEALPAQPTLGETLRDGRMGLTWDHDIGSILGQGGKYLWLTRAEYDAHMAHTRSDDNDEPKDTEE